MTLANGDELTGRGRTFYRLADEKIIEDDPLTTPDLTQALGAMMPPPAT
jgi:hypothetical protein